MFDQSKVFKLKCFTVSIQYYHQQISPAIHCPKALTCSFPPTRKVYYVAFVVCIISSSVKGRVYVLAYMSVCLSVSLSPRSNLHNLYIKWYKSCLGVRMVSLLLGII
uniref:Uncharacterized protein n=1 Tax=Cacopsylla melanoneura TaxID=428564 RepID=A0A8D8TWK0_9HEMI